MTAPDARQPEELREALAEALRRVHRGAFVVTAAEEADALLPVITAWHEKAAESLARERAAEELRAAARSLPPTEDRLANRIHDRADALTADDQPVQP